MIMFIPLLVIHIIFFNNEYKSHGHIETIPGFSNQLDGYFIGTISVLFVFNIVKIFTYSGWMRVRV